MTEEMPVPDHLGSVDELAQLLRGAAARPGGDRPNEPLDQLAHALQCADVLARARPDDLELQVAGLVHDVGHLLGADDAGHGVRGAAAVRGLLGARVAHLVELHVPAKRYLVATDPAYEARLSAVSTLTLHHQGGPMTAAEVAQLGTDPDLDAALELRRADEAAKQPGRSVPGLDHWRPVLHRIGRTTA